MKANYHTHTKRCNHATGCEEDYIKAAIKQGHTIIGFADHTPWVYDSKFKARMRMMPHEMESYVTTLRTLKEKYASQIEVKIGLECEYYEKYMDRLKEMLETYQIDYIILGNHFMDSDESKVYYGAKTAKTQILKRYVDDAIAAMETGLYAYVAHPDVIQYYDQSSPIYVSEMKRLCIKAKELNIPLEFNLLGYSNNRHYPCDIFWQIASNIGNTAILGIDAHDLFQYEDEKTLKRATDFLNGLGMTVTDKITYLR